MKALLQRVSFAKVEVSGKVVGEIDRGLLVFLGVEKADDKDKADKLLRKILDYRIFPDDQGKMNLSVSDIEGGLLLVSQFTLAADTRKGLRPGFSVAASPESAQTLYDYIVEEASQAPVNVQSGHFGADMQVTLQNDGPVTFLLECH